ncbi:hypothetical protein SAMN04487943_11537 [Gracilibacillus orientalis]|uniref:Uncharacterized protein n=1 Tax=Gracilibacillus orientalis TaxID=334253 RepID=A0A1I4Q9B9_9BACI|nr:hypothetical protein [Gracilibacillus orientalis]SFM36688.1 hypothetical protein SAMN04487943_11537 [Gracilibacillus orientalis]
MKKVVISLCCCCVFIVMTGGCQQIEENETIFIGESSNWIVKLVEYPDEHGEFVVVPNMDINKDITDFSVFIDGENNSSSYNKSILKKGEEISIYEVEERVEKFKKHDSLKVIITWDNEHEEFHVK